MSSNIVRNSLKNFGWGLNMEGVQVSIDRIVVEFTDVYWDFFNLFQLRLREYLNANLRLKEKGFKYHLHV